MNILHPSWQSHFDAFGSSDTANAHMAMFSDAMDAEKSKIEKINDLIEVDDTVALVKGKDGKLKALHNFKKIGGTRIRPEMQLICLIGSSARAVGIVVNSDEITKSKEITIPTAEAIWGCNTINELENVESISTVRRSNRRGTATAEENPTPTTTVTTMTYKESMCFIPPPFIVKQIFGGIPNDPLELILATKAAAIDFNNSHSSTTGFENVDATIQAKRFALWAFAVHKGHIEETSFDIDPDNVDIQQHHDERHAKCIMPSLSTVSSAPTSLGDHLSIFEQLGAGLNRMGEANETANAYAKRNMELKELEVENKKDRIKDLHPSTKHMLKMASATDSDQLGELCEAFKSFYNSKNHGAADIQLHQLMEDKGFGDAAFGEGVSMTLWSGNFNRPNPAAPGVLSPFSFKEQEPLGSTQRNRSLILSMILNTKGGLSKSIDELKASSKVETTVPSDYHGFIYQMKAFSALIEIITGDDSLVSVQLQNLVGSIEKYSSSYKIEIAQDNCFPGKFANVVDSRFHLFLQDCRKSLDREDVNNRLVDFRELHEDVLLNKFNVKSLPACFSMVSTDKTPVTGDTKTLDTSNNDDTKKGGGKRKGGKEGDENDSGKRRSGVVENKDQVPEFKMAEGKKRESFQGKCVEHRAKYKDTFMCPRFHTKGFCHVKCKFSASHIPAKDIPEDVKKNYVNYLTKIRSID